MERKTFAHDGLQFSYLEGGNGASDDVLLILHAHWMSASDFDEVYPRLPPWWRVVALDQRGHGETSHGGAHSVEAYIGDIDALLDHLGVRVPVVLAGHSFGGMVANLYAAKRPERVRAIVMEDIDVARDDHDDFILGWGGTHATREALEAKIGARLAPYLQKQIVAAEGGFRLAFDPAEVLASEAALNGNHWKEWLSQRFPALVVRGAASPVVPGKELEAMARRRQNTKLVTIDAGHSVHVDAPEAFALAVSQFLGGLADTRPVAPRSANGGAASAPSRG